MVDVTTAAQLPAAVREFLAQPRYAVIATINPDGSPHQAVVWYLLEDDGIILNSKVGRRWPSNAQRDPRVSITVEEGLDYAVLSGTLEEIPDPELAHEHIVTMGLRYEGPEGVARRSPVWQTQERVSFRLVLRRAEMRTG
jgi:PPOX class probable F420-dependent enzyme